MVTTSTSMQAKDCVAPGSDPVSASGDIRREIKEFLTSRRAKITPEMVGLPAGSHRRVPGLRREEVALLAGMSVDYYTRLERGNLAGASEEVLEALAAALHLSEAERDHLFDLAHSVSRTGRTRKVRHHGVSRRLRPGLQWIVDALPTPAVVQDNCSTFVASNAIARALYSPIFFDPAPGSDTTSPNMARFMFLDPQAHDFFPNWQRAAGDLVATLRLAAGQNPADRALSQLVGELSTRSRDFAQLWARHDVLYTCRTEKVINHPVVGTIHLAYEPTRMLSAPDLRLILYGVEPGSPSADAMTLLHSWLSTRTSDTVTSTDYEPQFNDIAGATAP